MLRRSGFLFHRSLKFLGLLDFLRRCQFDFGRPGGRLLLLARVVAGSLAGGRYTITHSLSTFAPASLCTDYRKFTVAVDNIDWVTIAGRADRGLWVGERDSRIAPTASIVCSGFAFHDDTTGRPPFSEAVVQDSHNAFQIPSLGYSGRKVERISPIAAEALLLVGPYSRCVFHGKLSRTAADSDLGLRRRRNPDIPISY